MQMSMQMSMQISLSIPHLPLTILIKSSGYFKMRWDYCIIFMQTKSKLCSEYAPDTVKSLKFGNFVVLTQRLRVQWGLLNVLYTTTLPTDVLEIQPTNSQHTEIATSFSWRKIQLKCFHFFKRNNF